MNKSGSFTSALVVIYNDVALYPPTINAIELLSEKFDKIVVIELITRNVEHSYKMKNIEVHRVKQKKENYIQSFTTFLRFTRLLNKLFVRVEPSLVLFYDTMAAMSVYLCSLWKKSTATFWYHNHDVADKDFFSRFSMLALGIWFEERMIRQSDIFSLPSDERKKYFNLEGYKGKYALIPNYPSKKLFGAAQSYMRPNEPIRIVYQGRLSPGHGFEEIIRLMPMRINNKEIKLELKGIISEEYKSYLEALVKEHNCDSFVTFHGFTSYQQLPEFTSGCQIGLAIYTGDNIMNSTLGKASNKVYEYTACGMPFIYFRNDHFEFHFANMPWAISTDLSHQSLIQCLESIEQHYLDFSEAAKIRFISELNFESVFTPVLDYSINRLTIND